MKDDFQPAFPAVTYSADADRKEISAIDNPGLSARDYFAAAALTGLLASGAVGGALGSPAEIAQGAYNVADAMLAQRKAVD